MLLEREPKARVFALDTHVLFPETYDVWREIEQPLRHRGSTCSKARRSGARPRRTAIALWERNPDLCCSIRKIGPLERRALRVSTAGSPASAATSRRAAPTTPKLGWDERHELWKASPLADWTDDDVWAYIRERELPVNPLHERGYASIGCTHCTGPGDGREGRWAGTGKTECGLHA